MPTESRPHLPRAFLAKLISEPCMKDKKSFIFSKQFHGFRWKLADHQQAAFSAECDVGGFDGGFFRSLTDEDKRAIFARTSIQFPFKTGDTAASVAEFYKGYSFLHVAVDDTDPPLACEMIRHGALIEQENAQGQTPLLLGLKRVSDLYAMLRRFKAPGSLSQKGLGCKTEIENAQSRIRYIVRVLIEQHANVNSTVAWQGKVVSSLHIACSMNDWELVALLLEYGAQSKPTPACTDAESFLVTATAKHHFKGLQANASATRPPRLCPCFSGKPMLECHSKSLPYPEDFTCRCGSRKAYGNCCKGRKIELVEMWDAETKWIQPSHKFSICFGAPASASPEVHAILNQVEEIADKKQILRMVPEMMFNPEVCAVQKECLEVGLRDDKLVDPAFRFAYYETKFYPSSQGRSSSKHWCRQKQKEWNAAVDKYIAGGTDSRPRFEIEAAAKVGISLGAMYRACEADGCDKVEGRDIEKVATCARCKMTFYCGPACQRAHWRAHKSVCGTLTQIERLLPSQIALTDFVCKYSPALMQHRLSDGSLDRILDSLNK
ncbi:hypothetical protein K438DRAFT_1926263 [Mycena galopus ATCC 62051]|nr:hypothetical protein K438DRAFT_1926263 [Mycena galopus ATCC 62051]